MKGGETHARKEKPINAGAKRRVYALRRQEHADSAPYQSEDEGAGRRVENGRPGCPIVQGISQILTTPYKTRRLIVMDKIGVVILIIVIVLLFECIKALIRAFRELRGLKN